MKIIQSFWSGNKNDFNNSYGWLSPKYNWMSWILSCHQLVKYHDHVELYTDSFGYDVLINKLKLPYTKVHVVLDELNNYHPSLWAIGKVKTFQLQTEPFIHVDGDVFVWESLTDKFKNSNLITQNLEITTDYYREKWDAIYPDLTFLPKEMNRFHNYESQLACNMGIIGGVNIKFFQEYCKKSIEFVDRNVSAWENTSLLNFNVFFEQVLFYEFANETNQQIDFLFDDTPEDNSYVGFGDFHSVPFRTYLHLLGNYKIEPSVSTHMETYVMKYYPNEYSNLNKLINLNNQNNHEIDFLTPEKVNELIAEFTLNLKNNDFEEGHDFLLKRDLYQEGKVLQLGNLLDNKIDFKIVLLKGVSEKIQIIEDKETKVLATEEMIGEPSIYEMDELDEAILHELANPIDYSDFITAMEDYFEEDVKEECILLVAKRLHFYTISKIIAFYLI